MTDRVVDDAILLQGLRQITGVPTAEFRPIQRDAVVAVLSGRDVYVQLSTSGGKSICFELPPVVRYIEALLSATPVTATTQAATETTAETAVATSVVKDGISVGANCVKSCSFKGCTAVVISPLISLMQDQCNHLTQVGVPVGYLSRVLSDQQHEITVKKFVNGQLRLLYVTPEKAVTPNFLGLLNRVNAERGITLVAVDEAHCISEWGHQFRPEYRQLVEVRKALPMVPFIALTATATPAVRQDIITQLNLVDPVILCGSCNRPNLFIEVRRKGKDKPSFAQDLSILTSEPYVTKSTIVYVPSVELTKLISGFLSANKVSAKPYNSNLNPSDREQTLHSFLSGEVRVVVATTAFGMGIDKPDIDLVVVYGAPLSLESLYQQIGRAGRNGKQGRCIIFWEPADIGFSQFLINVSSSGNNRKRMERLFRFLIEFLEDTASCRRKLLLEYFGEHFTEEQKRARGKRPRANCCDYCESTNVFAKKDMTVYAKQFIEELAAQKTPTIHSVAQTLAVKKKGSKGFTLSWWQELGLRLLRAHYIEYSPDFFQTSTRVGPKTITETSGPVMLRITATLAAELPATLSIPSSRPSSEPVVVVRKLPSNLIVVLPRARSADIKTAPVRRTQSDITDSENEPNSDDSQSFHSQPLLRCGRSLPPKATQPEPLHAEKRIREYPCEVLYKKRNRVGESSSRSTFSKLPVDSRPSPPTAAAAEPVDKSSEPHALPSLSELIKDPSASFYQFFDCISSHRSSNRSCTTTTTSKSTTSSNASIHFP